MPFVLWVLIAIGANLIAGGVLNRNPWVLLVSLISKGEIPDGEWYTPPVSALPENASTPVTGAAVGIAVTGMRAIVLQFATSQIGKPYVYGAAGPNAYDCSGLTMAAYARAGIKLPHNAAQQQRLGKGVPYIDAQPGDLLFWGDFSGHVAMYAGNGQMVHAPNPRKTVEKRSVYDLDKIRARTYF